MKNFLSLVLPSLFLFFISPKTYAAELNTAHSEDRLDTPNYFKKQNEFSLRSDPNHPRSYFWKSLLSFFLPGFGQWTEGQSYAPIYSGVAIAGLVYANQNRYEGRREDESSEEFYDRYEHGVKERKANFGIQTYMSMGGLSAYHSFRSAVRTQIPNNKFQFLTNEDEISEILLAPFEFQFLARKTTWIPLGIITALSLLSINVAPKVDEEIKRDPITSADVAFTGGISYHAGTYEEAVFRGWIMPLFMEGTGSEFWSNSLTSLVFASLHLSTQNKAPLPQLALGWHMGYVTQQNGWSLREAIFIHAWWDVIALISQYQLRYKEKKEDQSYAMPALILPILQYHF